MRSSRTPTSYTTDHNIYQSLGGAFVATKPSPRNTGRCIKLPPQ